MSLIPEGRYRVRPIAAESDFFTFPKSGDTVYKVALEVVDGEHAGTRLEYIARLEDEKLERTLKFLETLGMPGSSGSLDAKYLNKEAMARVKHGDPRPDGKVFPKVIWIDPLTAPKVELPSGFAEQLARRIRAIKGGPAAATTTVIGSSPYGSDSEYEFGA